MSIAIATGLKNCEKLRIIDIIEGQCVRLLKGDYKTKKIYAGNSPHDVVDFVNDYVEKGIKNAICIDTGKDGTLCGSAAPLYKELLENKIFF